MVEGLNLMIFGMGTVVIFLTMLVFAILVMSALVTRFTAQEPVVTPVLSGSSDAPDSRIIAVIEAAVAQHRANK